MKQLIKIQENIIGFYMTENQKRDFVKCLNTKEELRHLRYHQNSISQSSFNPEGVKEQISKTVDLTNVKLKSYLKTFK